MELPPRAAAGHRPDRGGCVPVAGAPGHRLAPRHAAGRHGPDDGPGVGAPVRQGPRVPGGVTRAGRHRHGGVPVCAVRRGRARRQPLRRARRRGLCLHLGAAVPVRRGQAAVAYPARQPPRVLLRAAVGVDAADHGDRPLLGGPDQPVHPAGRAVDAVFGRLHRPAGARRRGRGRSGSGGCQRSRSERGHSRTERGRRRSRHRPGAADRGAETQPEVDLRRVHGLRVVRAAPGDDAPAVLLHLHHAAV